MSLNSSNTPAAPTQPTAPQADAPKISRWRRTWIVVALIAWTFLGFMLAQAIGLAVVQMLYSAGVVSETDLESSLFQSSANLCIYILAAVLIIGMPRWIKKRGTTLADLGLKRYPNWMDMVWLLTGAFVYLILTLTITSLSMVIFPSADYAQEQEVGFNQLTHSWEYILAFVSLVIVAPVAEELIFRGYLFGKLRKYASVWLSVLLSAALFAVAHMQFNVALDTFALGIVLALLRVVTGSIWASIALHALKNGVAFYFLFVNPLVL
jgi:uncharacterized protein